MWCFWSASEDRLTKEWMKEAENIIKNIRRVQSVGKKCITKRQVGRRDIYLENKLVECFTLVERSLLYCKRLAASFLSSNSALHIQRKNRIVLRRRKAQEQILKIKMQRELLQLKQERHALIEENSRLKKCDDSRTTSNAEDSQEVVNLPEVIQDQLLERKDKLQEKRAFESQHEETFARQDKLISYLQQVMSHCDKELQYLQSQNSDLPENSQDGRRGDALEENDEEEMEVPVNDEEELPPYESSKVTEPSTSDTGLSEEELKRIEKFRRRIRKQNYHSTPQGQDDDFEDEDSGSSSSGWGQILDDENLSQMQEMLGQIGSDIVKNFFEKPEAGGKFRVLPQKAYEELNGSNPVGSRAPRSKGKGNDKAQMSGSKGKNKLRRLMSNTSEQNPDTLVEMKKKGREDSSKKNQRREEIAVSEESNNRRKGRAAEQTQQGGKDNHGLKKNNKEPKRDKHQKKVKAETKEKEANAKEEIAKVKEEKAKAKEEKEKAKEKKAKAKEEKAKAKDEKAKAKEEKASEGKKQKKKVKDEAAKNVQGKEKNEAKNKVLNKEQNLKKNEIKENRAKKAV